MHVKGIMAVTLIGTLLSIIFSGFSNLSTRYILYSLFYSFLIGASLWTGNVMTDPMLERIFRKRPLPPGKKLIYSLVAMLIVSSGIILAVNFIWVEWLMGGDFGHYVRAGSGKMIMSIELFVVIIIALVLYTNEFFHSWRDAVKNEEALKREKLALEYEALKNQVNPHFLFNSLNTLSGLIPKDSEGATRFVKQLSDIYRYVLEHKDRELVPLETEMKFVEDYISLMRIRFGDNLHVETDVGDGLTYRAIPLSIQMLVENAIKHNIISSDRPLKISIFTEPGGRLVVKNNLQRKSSILRGESGGWENHGLRNIKSRYEYLSRGTFEINGSSGDAYPPELGGEFTVRVPLIKQ